jgi:hypothetical protein
MRISILCGGVFPPYSEGFKKIEDMEHNFGGESKHLHIQIREDQINAITQFLSVTGVFNTYRLGVL